MLFSAKFVFLFPIFGIFLILSIPASKKNLLKIIALNFSYTPFILSLFIWFFFQKFICYFQFVIKYFWLSNFNLNFIIGLDGISLFFILLTALLIPLCLLTSLNSTNLSKVHLILKKTNE